MSTKILIATDPGVDDAMAILCALASPELEIVGISTVFGNGGDIGVMVRNACALLQLAERSEVPVAAGASNPLARNYTGAGATVHGANGLGGVELPLPSVGPVAMHAAQFIVELCRAHAGDLTLVTLAPLTNIALALRLDPKLPEYVPHIYVMGGAVRRHGNASPVGEANIHNDAEAARLVFNAGWEITLAALDVTHQVYGEEATLAQWRGLGNRCGAFLADASEHYLNYYRSYGHSGFSMHDVHAVAPLLQPDLYRSERVYVDVEVQGEITRGQTVGDWHGHLGKEAQTNLLTHVEGNAFKEFFADRIERLP